MAKHFINVMSWKSVLDKEDSTKLEDRVIKIVQKLERQGKDPLLAMKACASYLADRIYALQKERPKNHPLLTNRDPHKLGSKAWYEYMLSSVQKIMGVLTDQRLDTMLDKRKIEQIT